MLKENGEFNFETAPELQFGSDLDDASRAIHERAVSRAKKYLVAEADLLAAIIEVDIDQTYLKFGEVYLTPYCEKYLGLSHDVAGIFVRVARKSREVPALKEAVDEGLSVSKAKVILSVVTPENSEAWIEKAQTLTRDKLEKEVAKENPQPKKKDKAKPVGENRNRLEFEVNDEVFAMHKRALELASQKMGHHASLADLFQLMLAEYLKKHDPVKKAERAKPQPPWGGSSRKKKSTFPAAVKHAVNLRDQGKCQAKHPDGTKCGSTKWIHLHHIKPKAEGGADTPENLITLCSSHHREWHKAHSP